MRCNFFILSLTSIALFACKPEAGDTTGDTAETGNSAADTGSSAGPSEPTTGNMSVSETGGSASAATGESGGEPNTDPGSSLSESSSDPTSATGETGGSSPSETGLADGCEALDAATCKQDPDCMAQSGLVLEFEGCTPGQQFLACMDNIGCDDVLVTVCKDGTDEVYQLPNGCVPPGFTPCDAAKEPCGGGGLKCAQFGEADCKAMGCTPISGAPHVVQDGGMCADAMNPEFIGCLEPDAACPPVVATVCPEGQKMPSWDVPSGCIPAGFEACGMNLPECK
mgnify:CR=1 FL=1